MARNIDESTRQVTRLWTLAQPRISAFVTSVLRDFRDRDDLMQDSAVAVFDSFDTYDPKRPFEQRALGVAVEAPKPAISRGVFAKPKAEPARPVAPNSVFALGAALAAR